MKEKAKLTEAEIERLLTELADGSDVALDFAGIAGLGIADGGKHG